MYIPVSNSSSVASPVSANVSKIVSNPVQQQPLLNQPVILQHNYTNEVLFYPLLTTVLVFRTISITFAER